MQVSAEERQSWSGISIGRSRRSVGGASIELIIGEGVRGAEGMNGGIAIQHAVLGHHSPIAAIGQSCSQGDAQ